MTAQRTDAPIAVIDIGSNSIRLVIYASGGRYPFPLFNERSNCRLGEGLGDDGLLRADGAWHDGDWTRDRRRASQRVPGSVAPPPKARQSSYSMRLRQNAATWSAKTLK